MVDTATPTSPKTTGDTTAATVPATPSRDRSRAPVQAPPTAPQPASPRIDVEQLAHQLLGTWPEIRLAARARAAEPEYQRIDGQPMDEHRERVLGQLKRLVESGAVHKAFPKELGGQDDHGGNIAAFEE